MTIVPTITTLFTFLATRNASPHALRGSDVSGNTPLSMPSQRITTTDAHAIDFSLRHQVLNTSTTLPILATGTYLETDRTGTDFTGRGVNDVDNVFMGFSQVYANGQVDLPANFATKRAAASPNARQSVSLGGATYTDGFRQCLSNPSAVTTLIANTIALAQTNAVAIDFDFEFPASVAESAAYARLIEGVATGLNQPVFVALPYMSQMHWMLNSPEIKAVLENPLVYAQVFGYDMIREADPNGAWTSYSKGSCVHDDLTDNAQIQWIEIAPTNWQQTRLSIQSYLGLLTDTFGLSEDIMGRVHVGLPGYSAVQREDWARISAVNAADPACLVHAVTVTKHGVQYQDYAMTASDVADATTVLRNGSLGHHVGGVFIYEAGQLVGPSIIQGMVTAAGKVLTDDIPATDDTTHDDAVWDAPVVTAATTELCQNSTHSCVASRVTYGYNMNAALKSEVLQPSLGVVFTQQDIHWYTTQYANAAIPNGEKTGLATVELQAISRDGVHVASITIDDPEMQQASLNTVKDMFQNTVPGGSIVQQPAQNAAADTPSKGDDLTGIIVGCVIGGVITLAIIALCCNRRHTPHHRNQDLELVPTNEDPKDRHVSTQNVEISL